MHYYQHDIGKFAAQTRFMTPTEVGIFVILRDEYLYHGVPLVYDRITAMFPVEYETELKRVLSRCFVEKEGVLTNESFDELLAEYAEQAEKNRKNVQKRWKVRSKAKQSDAAVAESHTNEYDPYTTGIESNTNEYDPYTTGIESNTNAYLIRNQELGINNYELEIKKEEEVVRAREVVPATAPASPRGSSFSLDSLPDDWRDVCNEMAPDLDAEKVFDEFADFWRSQAGQAGRKKDWLAVWRNNIRNMPAYKREKLSRQTEQKFAFGKISEKYAHVLASKLADTRDPALSSISYGILDWRDAANHYADMMLKSERGFEIVKEYLVKHNIVEA